MTTEKIYEWTCPRCGATRPHTDQGAPSKVDPTTTVCSPCAHDEFEDERYGREAKARSDWVSEEVR
jgi:hypothetical protein